MIRVHLHNNTQPNLLWQHLLELIQPLEFLIVTGEYLGSIRRAFFGSFFLGRLRRCGKEWGKDILPQEPNSQAVKCPTNPGCCASVIIIYKSIKSIVPRVVTVALNIYLSYKSNKYCILLFVSRRRFSYESMNSFDKYLPFLPHFFLMTHTQDLIRMKNILEIPSF